MEASKPSFATSASGIAGGGLQPPGSDVPSPFESLLPEREIWVATYGNDDNSGSLFRPLQTITAAINQATPGTSIMVKAGRYYDILFFASGGVSGKPIWIRSADGYGAAELVSSHASFEPIRINGAKYIVIEGFRISGEIRIWEGPPPPGSPVGVYGPPAGDIVIQNNIIVSGRTSGVVDVRNSTTVYVLGNDITAGGQNAITMTDCQGCIANGNEITTP